MVSLPMNVFINGKNQRRKPPRSTRQVKKDEISMYIENALRVAIKETTGSDISMNDVLVADSSNETKWSQHLTLPSYFVRGAYKARKFTARILEFVPQRL